MSRKQDTYRTMSDSELIAAVKGGDAGAFDAMFLRWYPQVRKFLLSLVQNEPMADDLAQMVFMKVWIYRSRLEPSKSLRNYLFVLARNGALDVFRSRRHLLTVDTPEPPHKPSSERSEHVAEYHDIRSSVLRAVDQMPPQRREVFRMSRFQSLSNEEIASATGLSVRTVEKHLQLAVRDLKKHFS
jgi:RNA polymerase sigma-70 factor (ECF subfamily)